MSTRAARLAQPIEQGAGALTAYAQGLSDAQWCTVVSSDGRQVGVIVHHVASVYPIEVHLATEIAAGRPITGMTWGAVAEMNAKHAQEHQRQAGKTPLRSCAATAMPPRRRYVPSRRPTR